jgi:quercetin dioxygenase-like cupin family protein
MRPAGPAARPPISPKAGLRLVIAGVAIVGTVTAALLVAERSPSGEPEANPAADQAANQSLDIVQVQMQTYVPGQSSDWHRHNGVHALAVVSGTLTIYGPDCVAQRFSAGDAYIGGLGLHLARNETDSPVQMAVTYLFPSGGMSLERSAIPAAPPVGCAVA